MAVSAFFFCTLLIASLITPSSTAHNSAGSKSPAKPCIPSVTADPIPITLRCQTSNNIVQDLLQFADQRLATVYPIIQKFKSTITADPLGITRSWVGADVCNYRGFYCDTPPDNISATAVASVDFNGFHLAAASLDGFFDQLPDIALFHANSNSFAGTISPNLAGLRFLYELDISNNKFSGAFPAAVLGMSGLTFLDIRFNSFTGSVPPEIFAQNLDALFINNNDFMFTLPINLGTTHVLYLTLANNRFMGPIPGSIFRSMSSLTEVLLLNNQLTGCLPYEVGFLKQAVVVDFGRNRLMGPLPVSLSCLGRAEQLNFAGNLMQGMVPEAVCGLRSLVNLSLSENYFTVVGPLCRRMVARGVVDLRNNCVPDLPFQRPAAECVAFFSRARFCPAMWSYGYVPCRGGFGSFVPELGPSP